ncbi:hypothetical protein NMG60_11031505 [Bertholletia excelsa]
MLIGIRGTTRALKEEVQRLEREKLQLEKGEKASEGIKPLQEEISASL